MLRIPQCLDNRLTDGGNVVSPTYRAHFTPQKHYFYASGTQFCKMLSEHQGLVRPEGLGKLKKNSFTSSGLEPATFRLVVQCLNNYVTACAHGMEVTNIFCFNCAVSSTVCTASSDRVTEE
jgi:hypothetical protein